MSTVQVCPICDIAGCAHIREATLQATIASLETEVDGLRQAADQSAHQVTIANLRKVNADLQERIAELEARVRLLDEDLCVLDCDVCGSESASSNEITINNKMGVLKERNAELTKAISGYFVEGTLNRYDVMELIRRQEPPKEGESNERY